jgi:ubiquinone/menaquinone biosynthesis C-methylase UbiE
MPGSWFYDLMYRFGAPWELGVRTQLRTLVEDGRLRPAPGDTAIDLGCGSGAMTVYLAQNGWSTTGVDFSRVATRKAAARAAEAGVDVTFVNGDLTAEAIPGAEGPFDLLLDWGTLDDLPREGRERMAALMTRLAAPGARCFLFCFFAPKDQLPRISFSGASRLAPSIEPGEMERLFGADWDIEHMAEFASDRAEAVFLMTRRSQWDMPS